MLTNTAFPKQTVSPFAARVEDLLLICFYDPNGISTVPETVACMQSESRFSITVVNLFEHGRHGNVQSLSMYFNLEKFDAVVIHNSFSYNVDNLRSLDDLLKTPLRKFRGAKILMKQDENYRFKELAKYIGETGFDLIYTCLPPEAIPLVYPEAIVGTPRFRRMYTGYVTPTLRSIDAKYLDRPIDIGYRGSIQPLSFGRLAYEKRKIGEDVNSLLQGRDIQTDISSRWEDRLGSGAWFDFLISSKATLGAESGASIFDLDGDLDARCLRAEEKYGPVRDDADYAENYLNELADLEGNVFYNQVSPRHFEAAATRTLQIMYPGSYSGILKPGRHFVELARDYSNIDQIIELLLDENQRFAITETAYQEIVQNEKYWIETFVEEFDGLVSEILEEKALCVEPTLQTDGKKVNVLLICAHIPSLDPRLDWISRGAPDDMQVIQLGISREDGKETEVCKIDGRSHVITEPLVSFDASMLNRWFANVANDEAGWAGVSELSQISMVRNLEESKYLEYFNAPIHAERATRFKDLLSHVMDTTATLVTVFERMRGIDAVIATDLDALPAAMIMKGLAGVPAIYDAHEYWPESDVGSFEFEKQFWVGMEGRLVPHADRRQTVSPGLAQLMSEQYGCQFDTVPNCEPIESLVPSRSKSLTEDKSCKFIFQGGFAPGRGIDLLIDAWPATEPDAILILRGPDNFYKQSLYKRASETGLLGSRILFPDPVKEDKLMLAAQEGDVGLIPYTPLGKNYANCCPNKTSQYMAAGLPILANNTNFVNTIVTQAQVGKVVDFSKPAELLSAISWFIENPQSRLEMTVRANQYFRDSFNWKVVSAGMYEKIYSFVDSAEEGAVRLYPQRKNQVMYLDLTGVAYRLRTFSKVMTIRVLKRVWRLLPQKTRYFLAPYVSRVF